MSQNKTTNQGGTSVDEPKRSDQYAGGKPRKPKPRRMTETDTMVAASALIDRATTKVKEIKTIFDFQVDTAKTIIDNFRESVSKVPSHVDAQLDADSRNKIDGLEKTIQNADFSTAMTKAVDKATSGWLGEHKLTAWCAVIGSVLLMLAFGAMAISTGIKQGRAEEAAAQYQRYAAANEQDAQNWRQFKEKNPKTAKAFLQGQGE